MKMVKNIIAFFMIVINDQSGNFQHEADTVLKAIMNIHPDYLIEKFERYILSDRAESDWGIHRSIRGKLFNLYCKKYGLPITHEIDPYYHEETDHEWYVDAFSGKEENENEV